MNQQRVELIHTPDYEQIKQNFLSELVLASKGKPSSISFFRHHLAQKPLITKGIVQGIVIGGTNYIIQTVEIQADGTTKILKKQTGLLPVFKTKETLMHFFAKHLDERAQAIGINFGFPLVAQTGTDGEIDGTLAWGTKEHTFVGLTKPIGQLVKKLFEEKYHKRPKVSVANDTVCLTLAGDGTERGAFVAGTGFNMCLVIKEDNKKVVVNLESGNFDKFTLSSTLKDIDVKSELPGSQLLEKATSGKYLALYFNEKIKKNHSEISPIATSQELSELSHSNHTDVAGDLARAIITRSAYLVATAIAAAYEFKGKPESFVLIGEGSLLWNGWHYQENIYKQLQKLEVPQGRILLKHVQDSSINGAIGLLTK